VNLWKNRGLTKEQLVLGVPFYGYGFGTYKSDYTYASILAEFGADAATKDLIGNACAGCNYITYNGAATIKAKTQLGLEHGSGIMIWELSQDAAGANSLLKVIDDEINQSSSSSSSSVTAVASSVAVSSVAPIASSVVASSSQTASNNKSSGGGSTGLLEIVLLSLLVLSLQISSFAHIGKKA
jgi:hypothetical protein